MGGLYDLGRQEFSLKYSNVLLVLLFLSALTPQTQARAKKNKLLMDAQHALAASMTPPPMPDEVCFSPDQLCDVKLIKFIKSAQTQIDMAVFDINLDQVVHELLVASKRIKVRVVVDKRQAGGNHSLVSTLIRGGAQVRFGKQRGVMHDKFTIIDRKMIQTGSFNYTNHASKANQENQIYISTKSIVDRYNDRFEKIWNTAKAERSLSSLKE